MSIKLKLDAQINAWELLEHPFYKAWNAGALPESALAVYAEEYGAFVRQIPNGWLGIGDKDTREEEVEHVELWEKFAAALGTEIGEGSINETQNLVTVSKRLFQNEASTLGALYAFEVQQPETATTKLHGLREFFSLDESAEEYFIEHTNNQHEAEKLLTRMDDLDESAKGEAVTAAGLMAKALWDALTGIYDQEIQAN